MLVPPTGDNSTIRSPELANAVSPSEVPPILEAVASQRINIKGPKAGTWPKKRSWRVRKKGKGRAEATLQRHSRKTWRMSLLPRSDRMHTPTSAGPVV